MSQPILTLDHLSYAYEDQPRALEDISLTVHAGERIAVLGSNGAGKSTFFLCCNGVLEPHRGQILLDGQALTHKKRDLARLRRRVGIVFQDPNQQLIGSTVEQEISFGPMNLQLERQEIKRRIDASVEAMNLDALRERPPHYLSGGEKKRLSIADVLAMEPDIILFDEPTASLDNENTAMLEETLAKLHDQGKTLLVSTHDIDFAWRWADRLLVFARGHLIADGDPETLFADQALLEQAGLRPPMMLEFAELLEAHGLLDCHTPPRDLAQLTRQLSNPVYSKRKQ